MTTIRKSIFLIGLFTMSAYVYSQSSLQGNFDEILDGVLGVQVNAKAHKTGQKPFWELNTIIPTVSGKPADLNVKLEGNDIVILARVTPYLRDDDNLSINAQGEMWVHFSGNENIKHYSSSSTIELKLGEKFLFLPLGIPGVDDENAFIIELEIQINRYREILGKER